MMPDAGSLCYAVKEGRSKRSEEPGWGACRGMGALFWRQPSIQPDRGDAV